MNLAGDILDEEFSSRFREAASRKTGMRTKGRREKEINDLVASKSQLYKCWRKADKP